MVYLVSGYCFGRRCRLRFLGRRWEEEGVFLSNRVRWIIGNKEIFRGIDVESLAEV